MPANDRWDLTWRLRVNKAISFGPQCIDAFYMILAISDSYFSQTAVTDWPF
jgi:hypothetical protein